MFLKYSLLLLHHHHNGALAARVHRSGTYVTPSEIAVMYTVFNSPSDAYAGTPLFKLFFKRTLLNSSVWAQRVLDHVVHKKY